jgi:hypothetical protein
MSEYNIPQINQEGLSYNVLARQPDTTNPMLNTNFKFELLRLPNVSFWCTAANVPSVNIGSVAVQNMFVSHHVPGSSIEMDDLKLSFIVDEEFSNWNEIYKWMRGLLPFENFREIISNTENYYSDGVVYCLNNAKQPHIRIVYKKLLPVSLDGFDLNAALNDSDPITVNVRFKYESFDVEKVT